MRKRFAKIVLAALAAAGALAFVAGCGGPKVYNYGPGTPNITVDYR